MRPALTVLLLLAGLATATKGVLAQTTPSVVGRWQVVTHTIDFQGTKTEMHAALLAQRPCVAKVVSELTADGRLVVDFTDSGCDPSYQRAQERLNGKMKWRIDGDRITTSTTNFAAGQTYRFSVAGDRMTWTGTEGQGVIVYRRR
jgi:hypothetical protein